MSQSALVKEPVYRKPMGGPVDQDLFTACHRGDLAKVVQRLAGR